MMADRASEAGQSMNLLQRLIGERLLERGWSYDHVARRGGLPRSTLYALATTRDLAIAPGAAIIDALARGLEVPAALVRAIADESAGVLTAE